jgi:hypothetical protein
MGRKSKGAFSRKPRDTKQRHGAAIVARIVANLRPTMPASRFAAALLLSIALAACQTAPPAPPVVAPPGVTYAGSDGSSLANAVVIQTELKGVAGVRSEYVWLSQRYPGYKRTRQALLHQGGKSYDRLDITTADGRELSVYFDITAFFGKF